MSKTVAIKNCIFGQDVPKVCVPIVAKTAEEILSVASEITKTDAEVVEWRADHFVDVFHLGKVFAVLDQLHTILDEKLLLFTFRSLKEGGHRSISPDDYQTLCKNVCKTGWADLLDIELSMGDTVVQNLLCHATKNKVHTILSEHHFDQTPPVSQMLQTLEQMNQYHPDFAKVAVMPQSTHDVMDLLVATTTFTADPDHCAAITMSMGDLGKISRIAGQTTGSVMTFASVGQSSAPGQLSLEQVQQLLDAVR